MDHKLRGLDREGKLPWHEIQRRGLEDDYITSGEMQGPPDLGEALCASGCGDMVRWTDCHHCTACIQALIDDQDETDFQHREVWMWSASGRVKMNVYEPCPACKGPH